MALQSVIKIDHTLSISISIWVVDQSLAHDQQKWSNDQIDLDQQIDHPSLLSPQCGFAMLSPFSAALLSSLNS
jgi:hypothetical protein